MTHLTFSELERAAYISGQTVLADAYAAMDTLQRMVDSLSMDFDFCTDEPDSLMQCIENHVEKETAKNFPDYDAYKQFFDDCFEHLDGHYPCPSVTSDYDQSIIFNAIRKGESMEE